MAAARFADRTAIVTGGTYGIGATVTELLLTEGARVVVVSRGTQEPEVDLRRWGADRAQLVTGDVSDPRTSDEAVARAISWSGRLDAAVNNAAMDYTSDLLSTSFEDLQKVFSVNVFGTFFMLQRAAVVMREGGGGSIVNVTSRVAVAGVPSMVVYGASKGAVLSLTRGAAVELAPYAIRVNAVAPGLTETPLVTAWLGRQPDPEGVRRASTERIPQRRFGTPQDVASAVAYLASDDAAHVTGASIAVDGGFTAS
jgi:NAD(P)-dependent dehydrogenase (short-subunit alcohol dehydrogenase family)